MRFKTFGRRSSWAAVVCGVVVLGGCASPPAVTPLLRVVDRAMADAHDQLETDRPRAAEGIDRQRQALTDAFEADLQGQATLEPDWVRDHAMVYALAREVLMRHSVTLQQEFDVRQANLRDARRAQSTAIELIEQHDALFQAVPDARRWLRDSSKER